MRFFCLYLLIAGFLIKNLSCQTVYVGTTMTFAGYLEKHCGIVYKENGRPADPFISIAEHGANTVRFCIDLPPYSSSYSRGEIIDYASVENIRIAMQRAKEAGLKTILTLSYRSFALEDSQRLNDYVAPLAWQSIASDLVKITDSVYNYSYRILDDYCSKGLIPEIVAIGGESVWRRLEPNVPEDQLPAYDPERSVAIHNAGSAAVRAISEKYNTPVKICYHMMGPAQTEWWLEEHTPYGPDFDIIAISLYHGWNHNNYGSYSSLGDYIAGIINRYNTDFLVMETAQLFSGGSGDDHVNILGTENIPPGYPNPPTTETQKQYLIDITNEVLAHGGLGTIVWGGEWVGSDCYVYADKWGAGSSWENKTFWDFSNNLHDGVNWMVPFSGKVPVTFKVDMTGTDGSKGVFIRGDIANGHGKTWEPVPMLREGNNIFWLTRYIPRDSSGMFYFLNDSTDDARETIAPECSDISGLYRQFAIPLTSTGEIYAFKWSGCDSIPQFSLSTSVTGKGTVSPLEGTYSKQVPVLLTATPDAGWLFSEWSGDTSSTANPVSIIMNADKQITAVFVEKSRVRVTFKADMTAVDHTNGVYVTGDFENNDGLPWVLNRMFIYEGNQVYSYTTLVPSESGGAYYFLNDNLWDAREHVPAACAEMWNSDRQFRVENKDTVFAYKWGTCDVITAPVTYSSGIHGSPLLIFPNPVLNKEINIRHGPMGSFHLIVYDLLEKTVFVSSGRGYEAGTTSFRLPVDMKNGFYIAEIQVDNIRTTCKLFIW